MGEEEKIIEIEIDVKEDKIEKEDTIEINYPGTFILNYLLSGLNPLTISLIGIFVVIYAVGWIKPSLLQWISLVPAFTFPPHFLLWNVVTSSFVHLSIINLIINIFTLLFIWNSMEKIWGRTELILFIFFVNTTSAAEICFTRILLFPFLGMSSIFHETGGFQAATAGFVVAIKQLYSESQIAYDLRGKNLPGLYLLFSLILSILMARYFDMFYCLYGIFNAWVYLRWMQRREGALGDLSDEFNFASFFPDTLKPSILFFTRIIHRLCCSCFKKQSQLHVPYDDSINLNIPYSVLNDPAEAERRRALGLKTLENSIKISGNSTPSNKYSI